MRVLKGYVEEGVGHFKNRINDFPEVYKEATGEYLYPGTLNVKISMQVPIKEEFKIHGSDIDEPGQDLLFERCLINGINAYRIRPHNPDTGAGGHGDDTLEISCSQEIPNVDVGSLVEITLFRDDI